MNDSKWLFSIRNENDLAVLTKDVPRVLLLLGDYPNFDVGDFETLRFQVFEIWPSSERCVRFVELMANYYAKIYQAHKERNAGTGIAPKNFWPYSYQFYLCNPIRTFSCIVPDATTNPQITLEEYVEPDADRINLPSVLMPLSLLKDIELIGLIKSASIEELKGVALKEVAVSKEDLLAHEVFGGKKTIAARRLLSGINESLRTYLPLRDTDKPVASSQSYKRRRN